METKFSDKLFSQLYYSILLYLTNVVPWFNPIHKCKQWKYEYSRPTKAMGESGLPGSTTQVCRPVQLAFL